MWDEMNIPSGSLTISSGGTTIGSITTSSNSYGTLQMPPTATEDLLERYELNYVTVDHKVSSHELLKLKEVAPNYADEIKETLSRNVAREIIKKTAFTKKIDLDTDVHHFIGRVWVFTDEELKKLIGEARNVN
jgi:hypothetical protein